MQCYALFPSLAFLRLTSTVFYTHQSVFIQIQLLLLSKFYPLRRCSALWCALSQYSSFICAIACTYVGRSHHRALLQLCSLDLVDYLLTDHHSWIHLLHASNLSSIIVTHLAFCFLMRRTAFSKTRVIGYFPIEEPLPDVADQLYPLTPQVMNGRKKWNISIIGHNKFRYDARMWMNECFPVLLELGNISMSFNSSPALCHRGLNHWK